VLLLRLVAVAAAAAGTPKHLPRVPLQRHLLPHLLLLLLPLLLLPLLLLLLRSLSHRQHQT
jgi:hypothetical protein